MNAKIIKFSSLAPKHCTEEPLSPPCTERLHDGLCPKAAENVCVSKKFNVDKHAVGIPALFYEQH